VLVSYAGTIPNPDEVLQKVRDTEGVAAAAPLVYSQVMLSSGQSVSGVVVRGVPPDMEEAVIDLKAHLITGSLTGLGAPFEVPVEKGDEPPGAKDARAAKDGGKGAAAKTGKDAADANRDTTTLTGIILGQELAKQLGLSVGDPVSVVSPLGTPSP